MDFPAFDLDSLNDIVKSSGDAVRTVSGGLDAVKKVKELFSAGKEVSSDDMKALVLEVQEQLSNAKLANIELKEQLVALREAALQESKLQERFERYELAKTEAGDIALRLKPAFHEEEPPHVICQPCKESGRLTIMQGNEMLISCSVCSAEVRLRRQTHGGAVRVRTIWAD